MRWRVELVNGNTEHVQGDSMRVSNGVLSLRRAQYNGGIQNMIKSWPLGSVISWEEE